MKNFRFWVFVNGSPAKLTLRAGQSLAHVNVNREEGISRNAQSWEHDGRGVVYQWYHSGYDCDGRFSNGTDCFCPPEQLQAGYDEGDGIKYPKWDALNSSQRDYAAETMGY